MGEQTDTGFKPTPAIARDVCEKDDAVEIISTPTDTVTHNRGWGDSGYRVQVVSHDCPKCGFDRMIRRIDISPALDNRTKYWCLNPNCVHFVRDSLSYACHGSYPQRDTDTPAIFEA